jgi:hypothetical protein
MPNNTSYLGLYMYGFLITAGATLFGVYYFYTGMGDVSYVSYSGYDTVTYYLDKRKYDLYFNGLIYCLSFAAALLLLTAVILIPSSSQLQRRQSQNQPYSAQLGGSAPVAAAPASAASPTQAPAMGAAEPAHEFQLAPEFELSVDDSLMGGGMGGGGGGDFGFEEDDSDVMYGTGEITDEAHRRFLQHNTDSAIKYLLRKDLTGRPLPMSQEQMYEGWQKRGLSRATLRNDVCDLMGWDSIPDEDISVIYEQVQAQLQETPIA